MKRIAIHKLASDGELAFLVAKKESQLPAGSKPDQTTPADGELYMLPRRRKAAGGASAATFWETGVFGSSGTVPMRRFESTAQAEAHLKGIRRSVVSGSAESQALPLLQKICEVMVDMDADKKPVPLAAIEERLIGDGYFAKGQEPEPGVLRVKIWNMERYFRSGGTTGEYALRPTGVALAKKHGPSSTEPPWDRAELLGEVTVPKRIAAPSPQLNFFATIMPPATPAPPDDDWLPTPDSRARLRIGLGNAMQRRGISPQAVSVLFGPQTRMFLNGQQRKLPRAEFEVARRTLRTSTKTLMLARLDTAAVRAVAKATDFEAPHQTAAAREAILPIREAAIRHRAAVLAAVAPKTAATSTKAAVARKLNTPAPAVGKDPRTFGSHDDLLIAVEDKFAKGSSGAEVFVAPHGEQGKGAWAVGVMGDESAVKLAAEPSRDDAVKRARHVDAAIEETPPLPLPAPPASTPSTPAGVSPPVR